MITWSILMIGRMTWRTVLSIAVVATTARAEMGEFDRLEGEALARIVRSETVTRLMSLSFQDLDALPAVLTDVRAPLLVVKTGEGHYTRIIATAGLRKAPGEARAPLAVFVLERFDTFESGASGSRLARGAGVVLFDGFQIDLDSGLIVPAGQGGDLECVKGGKNGLILRPLASSLLFCVTKPLSQTGAAKGPSPGKAIVAADFAGRYTLFADGRWTGRLEIDVADDRSITGRFRSEPNGNSYPVTGDVATDPPHKAEFIIKFPRSQQNYEAYLWTEGKNVLAGTFVMQERRLGFFAVREGSRSPLLP
jgi:hypothetical protein